jgi:Cu+-exporting ATPase
MAPNLDCPVCGRTVDPAVTQFREVYDAQTYYFSSRACRDAFRRDPAHFVGNTGS